MANARSAAHIESEFSMFGFLLKSRFISWPILSSEGCFNFYAVSEILWLSSISEVPLTISDPRRILRRIPRDSWSVSRTARISSSSNASLIVSKSDARTRFVSYICVINIFMLNYIYVNFSFVNFHYYEENKLTKKSFVFWSLSNTQKRPNNPKLWI